MRLSSAAVATTEPGPNIFDLFCPSFTSKRKKLEEKEEEIRSVRFVRDETTSIRNTRFFRTDFFDA